MGRQHQCRTQQPCACAQAALRSGEEGGHAWRLHRDACHATGDPSTHARWHWKT
ncbi:hypothetical protein L665_03715 [Ralstonia solanacearum SD54]|nr:hypothetical protein F504_2551 [Ralstonia pseudosolanacearum FQY_4]ANH32122.1 hypothetical protein A3768_0952 [Ralstonia solanacearum]ARU20476.1 Cob(I)alamin adenosyltransferase PduO [Ralstonia solanacearum]ESS47332.1 hypothetical protein L665_03715 [Ralstonia solanacearum SD54]